MTGYDLLVTMREQWEKARPCTYSTHKIQTGWFWDASYENIGCFLMRYCLRCSEGTYFLSQSKKPYWSRLSRDYFVEPAFSQYIHPHPQRP